MTLYNEHIKKSARGWHRLRSGGRCGCSTPSMDDNITSFRHSQYGKDVFFVSLENKVAFLKDLEHGLSDAVTASELSRVLTIVSDTLQHYELDVSAQACASGGTDLFDAWIAALRIQNRSEKTIDLYRKVVSKLLKNLAVPVRNITVYHLRAWLAKEKERGVSDRTLENDRQIFSSFFGWLWREGLIEKNPVANLGSIKVQKKVREAYADVDIEKLKSVCSSPRDIAIITFLLATGCRVSEVTALNREDLNFHDKEVVVLGKGNKERTVFFDDVTAMHLRRYLATRTDDIPALFIGKRRERLQPGGVRAMLRVLAKAAGVNHAHPHKFRRTLATMLIAHGMPIQEVAAILGHDKLDTTMKYIVLDKSAVKNSYRRYA